MKNLITTAYLVAWAAFSTSPIYAMPFQLDFSAHWGQSASLLKFDFGGTDTISIASIFINEDVEDTVTGSRLSDQHDTDRAGQNLFTSSTNAVDNRAAESSPSGMFNVKDLAEVLSLLASSQAADHMNTDVIREVRQLISDKQDFQLYSPASSADSYAILATAGTARQTERAGVSFKSLAGNQVRTQAVPDPSPVWLIGLVLGITGITWRLWNLVKVAE